MKRVLQVVTRVAALGILLPLGLAALPARSVHADGRRAAGLYPPISNPAAARQAPVAVDSERAGSGGLKISTFYPVSQTDATNWVSLNYPTPRKATTFAAAQTAWTPFYFVYSGAVAKTTKYGGDVRSAAGTVVASAGPYTFAYASNRQEFSITYPNKADYPNGPYTAELTSGGQVVATTTFTVGDNTPTAGFKISTFYPISQVDNNNWSKLNFATPAVATTFAASQTWWIPFYLAYSGAVPKTTQYSGSVRNSAGAVVATAGPYTLPDESNVQEFFIPRANKADYPVGAYTAVLESGGKVVTTTNFAIGGPPLSTHIPTVSTFYSISPNDYNNWSKLGYATPALVKSFTLGKTWWIPFFFAYSGAVAKSTKYSVSVKNSAGKVVATSSTYTLPYATNTQEIYAARAKKAQFAIGAYTAELTVGGKALATTGFIVGR